MQELNSEEVIRLISELKLTGSYDYIVIDADFAIDKDYLQICRQAHALVWVGDGSEISDTKIFRAYAALSALEQNEDLPLVNRIYLIYNKFSNKTSRMVADVGIKNIGGAPRYEHASTKQILTQLSDMEMFNKIV